MASEAGSVPRKRTIVHVTWSLVVGGSEIYALTIASHLDAGRYQSIFCALDLGGPLEKEVHEKGMRSFIMHRRPGLHLGLMWRLYLLFRQMGVDVVHTHHFAPLFYSALPARLAGARVIHTEHCVQYLSRPRLRWALRLLSLLCFRVIGIGSEIVRTLRDDIGVAAHKLQVIPAGIDFEAFVGIKSEARQELGLQQDDKVAVIVARLSPEKNHRLLVRAFTQVVSRVPQARLLIVGEGIEQRSIQQEIARLRLEGCVQMLGSRRDVPRLLAAADLFVLSSDEEGLPIAVLEAMAAARPVVATAVGELPLLIRDGETGYLTPPGRAPELAEKLIQLLLDDPSAAAIGRRARRLVQEQYSVRSSVEKHQELYA